MITPTNLVSVAMASYNGAKYIGEQIETIANQSYKNIEIIIVDDCSQDSTITIIKEYQTLYPFIHLFLNDKNSGVTKTFETAISYCKGEFIAFSDQDDIWLPNKIEKLVNEIGEHDAVYANSMLGDEEGKSLKKPFTSLMNMKTYYCGAPFLLSNTVPGHAMLVKAKFIRKIIPFPDNLFYDLWIGFNAAANNGIKFIDEILVLYRQHQNNAVGTRMFKNKRSKDSVQQQFKKKRAELISLSKASMKDEKTNELLSEMIRLFYRGWSFKRSAFFFKNINLLLASKQKPYYHKLLYCLKMFFKPNF